MALDPRFVAYPSALVYALSDSSDQPPTKLKAIKHVLWGDWLKVVGRSANEAFYRVTVRGVEGWMKAEDTQAERLLEIVFVDIGQGDGALVVMPDDTRYVIDAGQGDNMFRFLRWRFGFKRKITFDAALISHSDIDHYGGFKYLFDEPNVVFNTVYTNGLMERNSTRERDTLGPLTPAGGRDYVTELVTNADELAAFLAAPDVWSKKVYPGMLNDARLAGQFIDFRMLSTRDRFVPGHGETTDVSMEVLGPFPERVDGRDALRWLGDLGKTKNGHSVVLRLRYHNVSVFLGGDLNIESSRYLLEAHTGLSGSPKTPAEEEALVQAARQAFACDIAKACHHGSADTLIPLIRAINPVATVVSSGDDEPHAHPRADAIGALAKYSRGARPLVFSTELSRSAKDTLKQPAVLRDKLKSLARKIADAKTPEARTLAEQRYDALVATIDRSVAVYGAINLRTDGTRVVLAYKLERSTASRGWDIYKLEPDEHGVLTYASKHD